ncbi:hypothetical protein FKR81_42850 [Lentzea tibetensis]|uniref:Nucleotidyltransferase AbiEii toxin of type IV toxin-antitoxin system n=1 Tax=Lentzea tibetensis TaxID=2591470 RepID=A0A563EE67_9PSEU|nr:hypothetical protein [Lentzea tibetensis]TWP43177.1 hypothetical protein FKR81_42850 [Lentzea tibetensis]
MQESEKFQIAKIVLDEIGQEYDFALAGSLAMKKHALTDRPVDDIDIFTMSESDSPTARTKAIAALNRHNYEVIPQNVNPDDQSADLTVYHVDRPNDRVDLQMTPIDMLYNPVNIDGLRVMAAEDLIWCKAQSIEQRNFGAKEAIDLEGMHSARGRQDVDSIIAKSKQVDMAYLRFVIGRVKDIPDTEFARYNVDTMRASLIRGNLLTPASAIAQEMPAQPQEANTITGKGFSIANCCPCLKTISQAAALRTPGAEESISISAMNRPANSTLRSAAPAAQSSTSSTSRNIAM